MTAITTNNMNITPIFFKHGNYIASYVSYYKVQRIMQFIYYTSFYKKID